MYETSWLYLIYSCQQPACTLPTSMFVDSMKYVLMLFHMYADISKSELVEYVKDVDNNK
jgi:hypothetical protein